MYKLQSPILFKINAFKADLFASLLVYQKLINKYEQIPTPSHPKNNCKKLEEKIKINIKKINKIK